MSISIENLAAELAAGINEYTNEIGEDIKEVVDKVTSDGLKELQADSPSRTGVYKKGWAKKTAYSDSKSKRNIIHNRTRYQINHLLEYGHASRYGGRVQAYPHIKKVEESMIKSFQEQVEKVVQGK